MPYLIWLSLTTIIIDKIGWTIQSLSLALALRVLRYLLSIGSAEKILAWTRQPQQRQSNLDSEAKRKTRHHFLTEIFFLQTEDLNQISTSELLIKIPSNFFEIDFCPNRIKSKLQRIFLSMVRMHLCYQLATRAVVVAQLVKWPFPTFEVWGSIPINMSLYHWTHFYLLYF